MLSLTSLRAGLVCVATGVAAVCLATPAFATAAPPTAAVPATEPSALSSQAKVSNEQLLRHLGNLGFASTNYVDSAQKLRNLACAWREITKQTSAQRVHRGRFTNAEKQQVLATAALPPARGFMVEGLNVSLRCQAAYLVKDGSYRKVFRVSTGGVNGLSTSTGSFTISRRIDGLHNSTSYPSASGWNMYRPAYFTSWGEAFHGAPSDTSVTWYPSTHGCVRMLQRDIDYLWRTGGNAVGTTVFVYGSWSP